MAFCCSCCYCVVCLFVVVFAVAFVVPIVVIQLFRLLELHRRHNPLSLQQYIFIPVTQTYWYLCLRLSLRGSFCFKLPTHIGDPHDGCALAEESWWTVQPRFGAPPFMLKHASDQSRSLSDDPTGVGEGTTGSRILKHELTLLFFFTLPIPIWEASALTCTIWREKILWDDFY